MDDGEKNQDLEELIPREPLTNFSYVGIIFQSFWIRCRSVFPNITDRKFMESELRLVLYCGTFFWVIYLLSQVI